MNTRDDHAVFVSSTSFSPDGSQVLLSSYDGTATIVPCLGCETSIEKLLDGVKDHAALARSETPAVVSGGLFRRLGR